VFLIKRGEIGERVEATIKGRGKNVKIVGVMTIPKDLPPFIDSPEKYINSNDLQPADILIAYTLHPDLTLHLARLAVDMGIKAMLIPGEDLTWKKLGSRRQLLNLAGTSLKVIAPRVMCSLEPPTGSEVVDRFAEEFGAPKFVLEERNGIIVKVEVLRGSPCGTTWFVAQRLIGLPVEQAAQRAGLLAQFRCRASRGWDIFEGSGGIYLAGEVHMNAVMRALKRG